MKSLNDMNRIHDKKLNNIAQCDLLHNIINPYKHAKSINNHYSSILHECMSTCRGVSNFKNFRILLDSGCISTILMRRLITKLKTK